MAFLMEQAGGQATTGKMRILGKKDKKFEVKSVLYNTGHNYMQASGFAENIQVISLKSLEKFYQT